MTRVAPPRSFLFRETLTTRWKNSKGRGGMMNPNPFTNPTSVRLLRILRCFGSPQQPVSC
jgi:hypothetical protein